MASDWVAADAADPFDYSRLPRSVKVILGYVGQLYCTPHVWTPDEVAHARNRGYLWAPIHTPPQVPFNAELGKQAGNLMVTELERYPLLGPEPVFLDIEHSSWAANPAEAMRGVAAWRQVMHDHGHRQAYAYLPWAAGTDWGANWINTRPSGIPDGYVGWQYAGGVDGDRYDLSLFRPGVFAELADRTKGFPMNLDADAQKWIVTQLETVRHDIVEVLREISSDSVPKHPHAHALVHIKAELDGLVNLVKAGGAGTVNVDQLAAAIVAKLGPGVADQVRVTLGRSLTNG